MSHTKYPVTCSSDIKHIVVARIPCSPSPCNNNAVHVHTYDRCSQLHTQYTALHIHNKLATCVLILISHTDTTNYLWLRSEMFNKYTFGHTKSVNQFLVPAHTLLLQAAPTPFCSRPHALYTCADWPTYMYFAVTILKTVNCLWLHETSPSVSWQTHKSPVAAWHQGSSGLEHHLSR